ncbi:hypothetical protein GE454_19835, partial [Pseudomonas soli]|uniref:hypothetical protein n=1 Tax=Pseudomonas soli TaxID=1306993 RepID=UPI00299DA3B5
MPSLSPDLEFARFCPILGVAQKVSEAPQPVIDLGVGVPGFLPAPHIVEAAVRAAHEDTGGYGASRGDPQWLKAYLGYLRRLGQTPFDERNLVEGLGATTMLFSVLRASLRPGDT